MFRSTLYAGVSSCQWGSSVVGSTPWAMITCPAGAPAAGTGPPSAIAAVAIRAKTRAESLAIVIPPAGMAAASEPGGDRIPCLGAHRRSRGGPTNRVRAPLPSDPGTPSDGEPRVERVAQAIAEQVDAEHGDQDGEAGEGREPPRGGQIHAPVSQHSTPRGRRWLHPEAE